MDVDDLVDAADAERKRKKDLRDLRRQSNKPSGDPKLSKQQQTGRAAQSKRDKEKAAKDKAAKELHLFSKSPIMTSRSSSQLLRLRLEVDREDLRRSEDGLN